MEPSADVGCVLAMDIDCEACKMIVMEVLSSIVGGYNVFIDAKEGLVKVCGEVEPNVLLRAISRTGRHARLVWAKLDHVNRSYYGSGFGSFGNPYRACMYRTTLPECAWRGAHRGYGNYYPFGRPFPSWPSYHRSYFSRTVPRSRFCCFGF